MIESGIEDFRINKCPVCGLPHTVKIDVHRNMIANDMNKDIRVPEFKKINLDIICPTEEINFNTEMYIQEDFYSKIIKLCKVDVDFFK
ncbi:MAG: hypothetical protein A2015_01985 [Spirochaetes bacterium GWF1_31_7]|nr:MAG: hypothetical protein A2Y30_05735 [Spirochaetes bacterium GWE1_32_154]OHD47445.1 MAG: hypothetical protein A2015_01985 [Spirochaetes bacterium GWF1_31_7]OHD49488.1 MAG: hypothetical protein A2Y29_01795 [Spirochaetes bacterium GWE2_31_10]OHD79691.1 MAG: hypothetical protein A2355_10250 [Spirochaetes bacterium RIFOXYB1_FULL_32_8]HBD96229.1 hypothetical protein [Spirochaetia bacterium]